MTDVSERDGWKPNLARFEIIRRMGDGGMGVVYEARDREHGTHVALKTLHRFDAETLLHLKQEFRALQDIHHPNLVALGELMRDGDTWFFTMELVLGQDLRTYLGGLHAPSLDHTEEITVASLTPTNEPPVSGERPTVSHMKIESASGSAEAKRSQAPRDEAKLRRCFAQLAKALRALHAAGKVHRDVKPMNVLVTAEERVVLFDFGLIVDAAAPQARDAVVGTARYMAPEQAANRAVGPPADWYSFGVVLYELLTGRALFEGDRTRVIERKLLEDPPRASFVAEGIPDDLDELCARLLDRDPTKRPSGAEIVRCVLGALADPEEREHPSGPPRALRPPFVGREREQKALRAAFDRVVLGQTVTVVVRGESGVGKSALVRRFVRELERGGTPSDRPPRPNDEVRLAVPSDVVVLAGRCYEREVVPYKAFDGVMDALCRHLAAMDDEDVAALLPMHASLLAQVFPVLRRLSRFDRAAMARRSRHDLVAHESRARLFETVRDLFAKLGARKTLVVVIDDLHWADADSLALLAELLRPPFPPRLLLLATARGGGRADEGQSAIDLPGDVTAIAVGRLDTAEALALARALLGGAANADGDAALARVAAAIALEAEGHPLFVDELVRHSIELGGLAKLPATALDDALAARAQRLEPRERQLLEMLAVAGVSLSRETAMRAAGLDFGAFAQSIATLRVAHLVRTRLHSPASAMGQGEEAVETYHDRVREAVSARLDEGTRRGWNRKLALALEAEEGRDPDAVATRWIEAGEPSLAAPYATEAAHKAFEALAYDRAAGLYARAIELIGEEVKENAERAPLVRALRMRLGDALASAGRGSEAANAFVLAAAGAEEGQALDLRRRAAEELLIAGNIEPGMVALRKVHADIGMWMPRGATTALIALLFFRAIVAMRGLEFVLRREQDIPRAAMLRIDACWGMSRSLTFIDPLLSAYFQVRMLLLALKWAEPYRLGYALALEAMWIASRGTRTRAKSEALLARSEELTRETGVSHAAALTLGASGFAALVQGRLGESVEQSDRAIVMMGEGGPGLFWETRSMTSTAMWALSAAGDLEALGPRVERALREALDRGDVAMSTMLRTGTMNLLWLRNGDVAAARKTSIDAMRDWTTGGYHNQHWWAVVAAAQADLYEGKGHDAWKRVSSEWSRARRALVFAAELVHFDARHLRARAALLAASQKAGDERERLLRRAVADVRWMERSGPGYAPPWVLAFDAYVALLRGDSRAASSLLARAIPAFDTAPVYLWAASARLALARLTKGEESRALREHALASMARHRIVEPERMANVFAPGCMGDACTGDAR